jgi:hypothetical protein
MAELGWVVIVSCRSCAPFHLNHFWPLKGMPEVDGVSKWQEMISLHPDIWISSCATCRRVWPWIWFQTMRMAYRCRCVGGTGLILAPKNQVAEEPGRANQPCGCTVTYVDMARPREDCRHTKHCTLSIYNYLLRVNLVQDELSFVTSRSLIA